MGNARFRLTGRRVALVLIGSLVAALLGFYLFDSPSVEARGCAREKLYVYPVKMVCMSFYDEGTSHFPGGPGGGPGPEIDNVTSAGHSTKVNMLNFLEEDVEYRIKAVMNDQVSPKEDVLLGPNESGSFTCDQFRNRLQLPGGANFAYDGFLVVESPVELEVVAVYTAGYTQEKRSHRITAGEIGNKNIAVEPPDPTAPPAVPPDLTYPPMIPIDAETGLPLEEYPAAPAKQGLPGLPVEIEEFPTGTGVQGVGKALGLGMARGIGLASGGGTSIDVEYIDPRIVCLDNGNGGDNGGNGQDEDEGGDL